MRLAAALALALAACAPSAAGVAPEPGAAARGLTPDANGLQPAGTALRIDFGRAETGVIDATSQLLGRPPASDVRGAGCPDGADTLVSWNTGLTLAFASGTFVGWRDAEGRSAGAACSPA